ncbi:MAG: hypothetical protein WC026_16435 [Hyphomicrobium sp.]|uniref:hypothetical protein n=1 Tax=Hyphomicrobium sp. TaxID=82 RepID=UPI0035679D18
MRTSYLTLVGTLVLFGSLLLPGFKTLQTAAAASVLTIDVQASPMPVYPGSMTTHNEPWMYFYFMGLSYPTDITVNPSAVEFIGDTLDPALLVTSSFGSWLAKADPASVFGSVFLNETGNRIGPGGSIISIDSGSLDIRNVTITFESGGSNFLGYVKDFSTLGLQNGDSYPFGVWGKYQGVWTTVVGDPVDTLLFGDPVGVGVSSDGVLGSSDQEKLDNTVAFIQGFDYLKTTFAYNDVANDISGSGSKTMSIVPLPEPGALTLFGLGTLLVVTQVRRKLRQTEM